MTYQDAVDYMQSLKAVGMQMGLERMETTAQQLGHPERAFKAIHIAGTNGKGSTGAMLEAMLRANGHRTGWFSSPFLTSPTEAIVIDGREISEDHFAACAERVKAAAPTGLSEYEFLTSLAFCAFEDAGVSVAVIECCLGGADDTTNILPPPLCAVFTPIALDHTAILGSTLQEIAAVKGGIIKAGCDVVCATDMHDEALGQLYEIAAKQGSRVFQPSFAAVSAVRTDMHGTHAEIHGNAVTISLPGDHQVGNAAIALTVANRLAAHGIAMDETVCRKALETVTMQCRQEIISQDPFIMLDGAHNPHGIAALCNTLKALSLPPVTAVIGMLKDKDVDTALRQLSPFCRRLICTTPQSPRAKSAADLAETARAFHDTVHICDDPLTAFDNARKDAEPILVCGSFYTAGVVREGIKKEGLQ